MTESFLSALREFLLAEAQECYWQQAVLREFPLLCLSFLLCLSLTNEQRDHTRMDSLGNYQ
jgi:hypothetical protein